MASEKKRKTSIVIVSYNTFEYTKLCIESIRQWTEPDAYELIVVDNASQDESIEWIKQQSDIKYILNSKNEGFPKGCNQGMNMATGSEILLLNSDTIVTPRWLEQMLLALYSKDEVGVVSCVTNICSNFQEIKVPYKNFEEINEFAEQFNHSNPAMWEKRLFLVGFCFLLKNEVYKKIGGFDEKFSPGNCEDDDYSLRVLQAGYELLLCKDTFIHHFGSASFLQGDQESMEKRRVKYNALIKKNYLYLQKKWGLSVKYKEYHYIIFKLPDKIKANAKILCINCKVGMDLVLLHARYPDAELVGVSSNQAEANISGKIYPTIFCPNIEDELCEKLYGQYDYILIPEISGEFKNPQKFIEKLANYLFEKGEIYFYLDGKEHSINKKNIIKVNLQQENKLKISACVITKNEVENMKRWLSSIKKVADEIIVVDTGSVDNTLAVVQQENVNVYTFDWIDDFAAAKNFALEQATGDWILFLDADEYFTDDTIYNIRPYLEKIHDNKNIDALLCQMYNVDADNENRMISAFQNVRIFRNDKNLRYYSKIHEFLIRKNSPLRLGTFEADIEIYHTGYSSSIVREKLERNLKILQADIAENGEKPWHYAYLADCYYGLGDYDKTIVYARKAIETKIRAVGNESSIYRRLIDAMALSGGNTKEILAVIEKAIAKFPHQLEFLWNKAGILFLNKNLVAAEKYIEKILILKKQLGNTEKHGAFSGKENLIHAMYGDILLFKGKKIEGLQQYKISLSKQRYNKPVLQKLYQELRKFSPVDVIEILQSIYTDTRKNGEFLLSVLQEYPLDKAYIYYAKKYNIPKADLSFAAFIAVNEYSRAGKLICKEIDLAYKCMLINLEESNNDANRELANTLIPTDYKISLTKNNQNPAAQFKTMINDICDETQKPCHKINDEDQSLVEADESGKNPTSMECPLVSVLIPTYNRPHFFKIALESVLAQSYTNLEIIICDNSTNEDTANLMGNYLTDHRVKYIRNKEARTKKENFEPFEILAHGEYLQWLMDDDALDSNKIEKMIQVFLENPEVTIATSNRRFIDAVGNDLQMGKQINIGENIEYSIMDGRWLGKYMLMELRNLVGEPSAVLFRRNDLKNHYWQAACRGYKTISDVVMWLELLEKGNCAFFQHALSSYRRHPEQEGQQIEIILLSRIEWLNLLKEKYDSGEFSFNEIEYKEALQKFLLEGRKRILPILKNMEVGDIVRHYKKRIEEVYDYIK